MTPDTTPGRQHQRTPILSPREQLGFSLAGLALLCLASWHLALVATTAIPLGGLGITVKALLKADPLDLPEPPAAPVWTVVLFSVFVVGTITLGYLVRSRWARRKARKASAGLATNQQTRASAGEQRARDKASYTRRGSGLNTAKAPLREVGLSLGTSTGELVVLSLEDQVGIFGPTGSGKTRYLMVGAALDAPGALIATSTRPELLDAIVTARSAVGKVWVFDPLDIAAYPEPMAWDPTSGAKDSAVASARGTAFAGGMSGADSSAAQFFQAASAQIMTRLLMAAAYSGQDMSTVVGWAADLVGSGSKSVGILKGVPGGRIWAETLQSAITGDDRTVANTAMTMGQKIEPILPESVLRQLIPAPGVPAFDPAAFVQSRDTLVLITDDQARTSVASLSTMLLNEVIDAAKAAAALSETGMLDPPVRIVGDEIANVAPLPKLPGMLSDSRGLGLQWVIAVQSLAQLTSRWGKDQAEQILSNLNCSVVLGGLQDKDALDRFSALCGDVELTQVSSSIDANHQSSGHSVSMAERTVLRPEEIRHLPDGQALVLLRNARPMIVDLVPYDRRPDGAQITADKAAAARRRRGKR
jgi:type IV secretion system protein VirD4